MRFKIPICNFRRFWDHLGIKNRRIVFIFGMCIVDTSFHNILSVFGILNVETNLFLKKMRTEKPRTGKFEIAML